MGIFWRWSVSVEETRKQKVIGGSFRWEQITEAITAQVPPILCTKRTGWSCLNIHTAKPQKWYERERERILPLRMKKSLQNPKPSLCFSDSTLGICFQHLVHILDFIFFILFFPHSTWGWPVPVQWMWDFSVGENSPLKVNNGIWGRHTSSSSLVSLLEDSWAGCFGSLVVILSLFSTNASEINAF